MPHSGSVYTPPRAFPRRFLKAWIRDRRVNRLSPLKSAGPANADLRREQLAPDYCFCGPWAYRCPRLACSASTNPKCAAAAMNAAVPTGAKMRARRPRSKIARRTAAPRIVPRARCRPDQDGGNVLMFAWRAHVRERAGRLFGRSYDLPALLTGSRSPCCAADSVGRLRKRTVYGRNWSGKSRLTASQPLW